MLVPWTLHGGVADSHMNWSVENHFLWFLKMIPEGQLLNFLVMLFKSIRRSTVWHLNQTLLRANELIDQGLEDKSINFPDFQELMVVETLC